MNAALEDEWPSQSEKVKKLLEERLKALDEARVKLSSITDLIERQELLAVCQRERAAISVILKDVGSIGDAIGVIVTFLGDLQGSLDVISGQLQELHADVKAMRADLQRLTGRPVLEVVDIYRQRALATHAALPSRVYIPQQAQMAGPKHDFHKTERFDLMTAFEDFLSPESTKSVLLVSGCEFSLRMSVFFLLTPPFHSLLMS